MSRDVFYKHGVMKTEPKERIRLVLRHGLLDTEDRHPNQVSVQYVFKRECTGNHPSSLVTAHQTELWFRIVKIFF